MPLDNLRNSVQQFEDTDVIAEIVKGNTAMFELIIRRYNPYLYKVGRSHGFNHQDTEDLMQETFISAYTNLAQFAGRSSFKTWLIRVMLNHCHRKTAKFSFQKEQPTELLPDNANFMFLQNNHSDNSNTVIKRELNTIIETALQQLPHKYRIAFTLHELTGLTVAETADIMHSSPSNIKVRLNRAKALLRKEIEKTYTTADIYEFNLIYCDKMVQAVMTQITAMEKTDPPASGEEVNQTGQKLAKGDTRTH